MGFWKKAPARDVRTMTAGLGTPAIHVVKQDLPTRSHFGGVPKLPPAVPWPERNGKRLAFLARMSLAEMHHAVALHWLPATGALLFFYDVDDQPWGWNPDDRGAWAVIPVPDLDAPARADDVAGGEEVPVAFRSVGFRRVETRPGCERDPVKALQLTSDESDAYAELRDQAYGGLPKHHCGGFPDAVQGDYMELESQLASHGINCGDPSGYADPRAKVLEPGVADWRLLLQFDTDDDLGVMWGDCGMLYFWVCEEEARSGDFRGAWLILQCS